MSARAVLGLLACAAALPASGWAQRADSASTLRTIVVTAERTPAELAWATASVSRIDASRLEGLPHATVADALRLVPGIAVVDGDGLGFDPRLMVRGFYGGGETEYAIVMVDGEPVNLLQSGSVAWETLPPLEAIEAIEIVRGSSSPLYGDAAVGAVINIITKRAVNRASEWSLSRGAFDSWRAAGGLAGDYLWRDATLSAELHRTNGFRHHGERTSARVAGGLLLRSTPTDSVMVETRAHWREVDDPGPLLDSLKEADRSSSDPFFRFDRVRDRGFSVRVRGLDVDDRTRATASLGIERRLTDAIRTVPLARDFADTKARDLSTTTVLTGGQIHAGDTPLPADDEILIGVEGSRGWLTSSYRHVMDGIRATYAAADETHPTGPLLTEGDATRTSAALFAQYSIGPAPWLHLSLGGRYDWLWDSFLPTWPNWSSQEPRVKASHSAFSPKAGVNVRYMNRGASTGHVYVTASRSFRAPTLDQLFDQRQFPPGGNATSNPLLDPQHGVNLEAGVYQSAVVGKAAMLTLSASAYQMDMKDELDFDLAALRYVNIGRSRHRGLEAGLRLGGVGSLSVWLNHTVQSAAARSGDNSGRALKAIPKHVTATGASIAPIEGLTLQASVSHTRDIFLDDAKTVELPTYTRVDAAAGYRFRGVEMFVDVRNLLDAEYSTTGFLDPSGTGAVFFHPAAGRVIQLGLRGGR